MTKPVRFQPESIASQVARHLRNEITAGRWSALIPSERELCERLRVSRGTVRAALAILQKERLLETRHGIGSMPRVPSRSAPPAEDTERPVCLLMPDPLNLLRPYVTIWIDLLRGMLMDGGRNLQLYTGQDYFRPRGARYLERLVMQHPALCWVLVHSNERVQRWFEAAHVPCVVLGTPHAEIALPSVSLDIRSVCRHAAGEFLRLGHRRLGVLTPLRPSPGATQGVLGFQEAVRAHGGEAFVEILGIDDDDVNGACRQVNRAISDRRQLTGLMVINPLMYVAVQSTVQGAGLRIPADVSLMTTYGDPFLNYVRPTPARYTHVPAGFVRKLMRSVLRVGAGDPMGRRAVRVTPEFVPGDSIGAVRAEAEVAVLSRNP